MSLCQFLIGNVRQNEKLDEAENMTQCQFLIGNVRPMAI